MGLIGCDLQPTPPPGLDLSATPACHQHGIPAVVLSEQDPARAIAAALQTHELVLLGEHHGDVAEIDFLIEVLGQIDRPTILAMELLPQTVTDTAPWSSIVGDKYWPAPLHISEYEGILAAVQAARDRGVDLQFAGLAPDCRLPERPTSTHRAAAIACFKERDAFMVERLHVLRRGHPTHAVLISAGWRHVTGVRLRGAAQTLGQLVPAHWSALRVLLAGTEARASGAEATCQGTPRALAAAVGHPVLLDTTNTRWSLDHCLDTPTERPLSDAFDQVVGLPKGPAPTALDTAFFETIPATHRAAWTRTRQVLMNQNTPDSSPAQLAQWAAEDVSRLTGQLAAESIDCPKPQR